MSANRSRTRKDAKELTPEEKLLAGMPDSRDGGQEVGTRDAAPVQVAPTPPPPPAPVPPTTEELAVLRQTNETARAALTAAQASFDAVMDVLLNPDATEEQEDEAALAMVKGKREVVRLEKIANEALLAWQGGAKLALRDVQEREARATVAFDTLYKAYRTDRGVASATVEEARMAAFAAQDDLRAAREALGIPDDKPATPAKSRSGSRKRAPKAAAPARNDDGGAKLATATGGGRSGPRALEGDEMPKTSKRARALGLAAHPMNDDAADDLIAELESEPDLQDVLEHLRKAPDIRPGRHLRMISLPRTLAEKLQPWLEAWVEMNGEDEEIESLTRRHFGILATKIGKYLAGQADEDDEDESAAA
jgi:hypothetical protein